MRRNARRKALYLEKKEKKSQCQENPKAAENTTAAAKTTFKELGDMESRRITTSMENQRNKGIAEVENPPGRLPQLDGDMEDENKNDGEEDEEGLAEDGSDDKSELEIVKEILDDYVKSLDRETLVNQPVKEVSDLKVALSNILKKRLMSKNCL